MNLLLQLGSGREKSDFLGCYCLCGFREVRVHGDPEESLPCQPGEQIPPGAVSAPLAQEASPPRLSAGQSQVFKREELEGEEGIGLFWSIQLQHHLRPHVGPRFSSVQCSNHSFIHNSH